MKSAILGLRKRETYDELINDLNHEPIGKYPDRTASQIENSNYLSQLRGGIEQMIIQSDNVMKEKQKELLLREEAGNAPHSHHQHVISENQWRHHVPPDEPTPEAEALHTPLRVPVGEPREYAPEHDTPNMSMSDVRSRSNRKASQRNSPLIQEAQHFQIGTPRSRSPRKAKFKIAHDVDNAAEQAHEMKVEDEEMIELRNNEIRENFSKIHQSMLAEAQNQEIEDMMTGRGDKRREEGANPKPAQPKARTSTWKQQDTRWTKDEPIPKAPPPKAKSSPEADHEPRGPRGRPKSTPASSSTDTPYAKAQAKAKAAAAKPEETQSKPIPVKKNSKKKPAHDTDLVVLENFNEWNSRGKGFLVDQIRKRPGIKFSNTDAKRMSKKDMIDKLLRFDGKI